MKIWYHVIAAVVGLALAALIVYLVFGSASQEGAVQSGTAPGASAAATLCGTISPGEANSKAVREQAAENPPSLFDDVKPIAGISDDQPKQQAWVNRVHAASGLCIDELHITSAAIRIEMSTGAGLEDAQISRLAAGTIRQAFSRPLNRNRVVLIATVDGAERRIAVSARAWRAFEVRLRQLKRQPTVANLKLFRAATDFGVRDLRIIGWP